MAEDLRTHANDVLSYLARLYDEDRRTHACRAETRAEFSAWQKSARAKLIDLLGIPKIASDHRPHVKIDPQGTDMPTHVRFRGWIETEPDVRIAFWLLRPKLGGPYPLAVAVHGHDDGDELAGVWKDEAGRKRIADEQRDVAVQAASRGFLTIVPSMRGFEANPGSFRIADIGRRFGGRDCRCHNWQVMMVGRTALGERIWDLMRILDWALSLDEVNGPCLVMGNSGGGMVALHGAACDERISIAVGCGAFNNYVTPEGTLRHCPCNAVPGLLEFGEFWDVAGLIAPRPLLTVNGNQDEYHPVKEVDRAVSRLEAIYRAAGVPERYEHRYGDGGHRFFSERMWPWILDASSVHTPTAVHRQDGSGDEIALG